VYWEPFRISRRVVSRHQEFSGIEHDHSVFDCSRELAVHMGALERGFYGEFFQGVGAPEIKIDCANARRLAKRTIEN
jgi:hypothetical protein